MSARRLLRIVLCALVCHAAAASTADDPCAGFKWDLGRERELFASSPEALTAGTQAKAAPTLRPDRLYELMLVPQQQVSFAAPPGKTAPAQDSYAGLPGFVVPAAGDYRVSVDQPAWVDAVR